MKSLNKTTTLLVAAIIFVAGCIIASLYYGFTLYNTYQQELAQNVADIGAPEPESEPVREKTYEEKKALLDAMMAAEVSSEVTPAERSARKERLDDMVNTESEEPYSDEEYQIRKERLDAMMAQ